MTGQATSNCAFGDDGHTLYITADIRDAHSAEGEGQWLLKAAPPHRATGILSVVEVPTPAVGDEDVLVRVRACGICGSDVHGYDGSTGRRIPPLVMGHEAAGVIEQVGQRRHRPRVRAIASPSTPPCLAAHCDFCRRGQINLCDRRTMLGVSCGDFRRHGAFAEFVSVPARIVYRLPDAAAVRACCADRGRLGGRPRRRAAQPRRRARHVVVIGCGMIGLLVIQTLREQGCRSILAVDIDQRRKPPWPLSSGPAIARWSRARRGRRVRGPDRRRRRHAFEVVGFHGNR